MKELNGNGGRMEIFSGGHGSHRINRKKNDFLVNAKGHGAYTTAGRVQFGESHTYMLGMIEGISSIHQLDVCPPSKYLNIRRKEQKAQWEDFPSISILCFGIERKSENEDNFPFL